MNSMASEPPIQGRRPECPGAGTSAAESRGPHSSSARTICAASLTRPTARGRTSRPACRGGSARVGTARQIGGFSVRRQGGRPRSPRAIRRDFSRGLRLLARAAHLTPGEALNLLEAGDLLSMALDAERGIGALRPLARLAPGNPRAPRLLADLFLAYEGTGRTDWLNDLDPDLILEIKGYIW